MMVEGCDNVDKARRILRAAEDLGFIKRMTYRPSAQQCFFGSNSQFGKAVLDSTKTAHDEVSYDWEMLEHAYPPSPGKFLRMIHKAGQTAKEVARQLEKP